MSDPAAIDATQKLVGMLGKWLKDSDSLAELRSKDSFWSAVKLVHAGDLRDWGEFKVYDQHDSISYAEYHAGALALREPRQRAQPIFEAEAKLARLESEEYETYDSIEVALPRSLRRKTVAASLPEPPHPETRLECAEAEISGGVLRARGGWKTRSLSVRRSCPGRVLHREEAAALRRWLEEQPAETRQAAELVRSSRFAQPVLFISHRWESPSHPDPRCDQYRRLRELRDCYLIYDYSSFPQDTRDPAEKARLLDVLNNMNRLIKNVVILDTPGYLERGWCLYEYVLAAFHESTVCDEITDEGVARLRNLRATRPTTVISLRGDSMESQIQNTIAVETLKSVNGILPRFAASRFTVESDRQIVTRLFVDALMRALPNKKETRGEPYATEWYDVSWQREEIERAFQEPLTWGEMPTLAGGLRPYELKVPRTLAEAAARGYALDEPPPNNSLTFLSRVQLPKMDVKIPFWLVWLLEIGGFFLKIASFLEERKKSK